MMARTLSAVAAEVSGQLVGEDRAFGAVGTDTRSLGEGSLFIAIRGERFDGNDYIAEAEAKGAAGALVSRRVSSALAQIQVDDTRLAFGAMARAWRRNFALSVVAVTGSAGKTTVKEMIASILRVNRKVAVTRGNLNNDIGVPLTLMTVEPDDQALVAELGANHAGEIDYLAGLCEPTVGVITNAAAAHLEGFGSLEGVAQAKGELLEHLPAGGTAVLNADDTFFEQWCERTSADNIASFGLDPEASCHLLGAPVFGERGSTFDVQLPHGEAAHVELALPGQQNVINALAAAAAASTLGVSAAEVSAGLAAVHAVSGRMLRHEGVCGAALIDDSYNANPASARAALDYLSLLGGRRVFVLGDMLELGTDARKLHEEIGRYAGSRCDDLLTVGPLAAEAARAFGARAQAFDDIESAHAALLELTAPDVTVLVKASRSMGLDRLVQALRADAKEEPA